MKMTLVTKLDGEEVVDVNSVMDDSGIDSRMGFEDIGLQSDGTMVIFDKCGNFGYIDETKYDIELKL